MKYFHCLPLTGPPAPATRPGLAPDFSFQKEDELVLVELLPLLVIRGIALSRDEMEEVQETFLVDINFYLASSHYDLFFKVGNTVISFLSCDYGSDILVRILQMSTNPLNLLHIIFISEILDCE